MSDMNETTDRAVKMIDRLTDVIFGALEVAAEKADLALRAAQVRCRAEALFAVLEGVGAHRAALEEKLADARGPIRALLAHQIAAVEAQQVSILTSAGFSPEEARAVFAAPALPAPAAPVQEPEPGKVVVRQHTRTRRSVEALNGHSEEN